MLHENATLDDVASDYVSINRNTTSPYNAVADGGVNSGLFDGSVAYHDTGSHQAFDTAADYAYNDLSNVNSGGTEYIETSLFHGDGDVHTYPRAASANVNTGPYTATYSCGDGTTGGNPPRSVSNIMSGDNSMYCNYCKMT